MIQRVHKQRFSQSSQSGFTIIESLLAILVVSILMTAITPVIVLSVATRVQAKRVELGTQAARTYIDGVRAGTILPPSHVVTLSEVTTDAGTGKKVFTADRGTLAGTSAPAGNSLSSGCASSASSYPYCVNTSTLSLYCADFDGGGCTTNSLKDMVIQAFRTAPSTTATGADKGYLLVVRVYRADAFDGTTSALKKRSDTGAPKAATFTGGLGDRKVPQMELVTEVVTTGTTYRDYCDRFGGC